jgi:hypothetical protein
MFMDTIGSSFWGIIQTSSPFESLLFSIAGNANFGWGPGLGSLAVCSSIFFWSFFSDFTDVG